MTTGIHGEVEAQHRLLDSMVCFFLSLLGTTTIHFLDEKEEKLTPSSLSPLFFFVHPSQSK